MLGNPEQKHEESFREINELMFDKFSHLNAPFPVLRQVLCGTRLVDMSSAFSLALFVTMSFACVLVKGLQRSFRQLGVDLAF